MFYCGYFGQTLAMFEGWFSFQGLLKVWTVLFLLCWFVYNGCPLFYVQTNLKKNSEEKYEINCLHLSPRLFSVKRCFIFFQPFWKTWLSWFIVMQCCISLILHGLTRIVFLDKFFQPLSYSSSSVNLVDKCTICAEKNIFTNCCISCY